MRLAQASKVISVPSLFLAELHLYFFSLLRADSHFRVL
jgi:hypothetical protein